jgi:selenocysteine-specific elongation factor
MLASAPSSPNRPTRHIVVGTAGHIDHGKTSLVKALTGIDCDRLPEERARGITIDLGFASFSPAANLRVGIVDVPGHERFVKNMVAGTGGIDAVLLVVAADEGVMPQTREHFDICRLLGIPRGVVALTKVDLVDADWLALVSEDVRAFVAGSFLAAAPIAATSTVDGRGFDALRDHVAALAREAAPRPEGGAPRLPIDRVFTMPGFGTVVTGTLVSGRLHVGDVVECLPGGTRARVRGLHAYGEECAEVHAGMRVAVNLQGTLRSAVARGDVLTLDGALETSHRLDADVTLLPNARRPLATRARRLCHIGTAQSQATIVLLDRDELAPGDTAPAQLRLERPIAAMPGDRFILRGFESLDHYGRTIGGGVVLDAHAPVHKRRGHDDVLERLASLRSSAPEARLEVRTLQAGAAGFSPADLGRREALSAKEVERAFAGLLSRGRLTRFDRERGACVHEQVARVLCDKIEAAVAAYHAAHADRPGIPREELRSMLGRGAATRGAAPELDPKLFAHLLARLEGRILVDEDHVRSVAHRPSLAANAQGHDARIRARLAAAGLEPPTPKELAAETAASLDETLSVLRFLVKEGSVIRTRDDLFFASEAVDALRERLVEHLRREGEITTQAFKEMTGLSRKFVIPLQEYFDAAKVTLRVGDKRVLRTRA